MKTYLEIFFLSLLLPSVAFAECNGCLDKGLPVILGYFGLLVISTIALVLTRNSQGITMRRLNKASLVLDIALIIFGIGMVIYSFNR